MIDARSFLTAFAIAAACTLAAVPLARRLAARTGAVAMPKPDRWHKQPVPLLGGVAMYVAVAIGALLTLPFDRLVLPVAGAATSMFLLGLIDDYVALKPSTKLNAQIAMACGLLVTGVSVPWTASAVANALLTILLAVAVTNAFNLLDNMDGLCAGIAAIAGLAFASTIGPQERSLFLYAALLAGAASAFLVFNFKPASIFLGDSGSLFIGASFAGLAVSGGRTGQSGVLSSVAVPALLLMIPLFDAAFVTVSRKLSARAASVGGRDHTSHRLVALGFSERQAVLILYGLAGAAAATAVALRRTQMFEARVALPLLVIGLVLLGIQLARVNVYGNGTDMSALRDKPYTPLLLDVTYKRRLFEVLLDLCLVSIAYYASYVIRFDREFPLYYELLVQSLPIVIGCHLVSFFVVGVYRGVWRYFSASDLTVYAKGIAMGSVLSVLVLVYLYRFVGYSRGVFIINAMALGLLVIGSRASFRVVADSASRRRTDLVQVLVYGAGDAGAVLLRELRNNHAYHMHVAGLLDDDPRKIGKRIMGVPVLGTGADLERVLRIRAASAVIISTAKVPREALAGIERVCHAAGADLLQFGFRLEPVRTAEPDVHARTGLR